MASTSRAAPAQRKPDVFVNFRGKDTRDNFISHLLVAMVRNGISAYTDHELGGGEEISPTLSYKISESPVSVAVFSPNYADSWWCLEELVLMIQCMRDNSQTVLPVFLQGVEPTHVRRRTGPFGVGFGKLIQRGPAYESKKKIWEEALEQAANLSSGAFHHSSEAEIIEKLVKRILSILGKMCSSDYDRGFFGTHRIEEAESILFSKDMSSIGIWGMGGLGKTTLAQKIRDRNSSKFNGVCFIENVREHAERGQLDCLQKKLLTKLLGKCQPNEPPWDIHDNHTKVRLSRISVLIILDDVSDVGQIEAVIGDFTNFGRGSKMIAIGRDKQVLNYVCDVTYEMQTLDNTDSLQLLKHIMFKQMQPTSEQMVLLQQTVEYAQGLPLALVVLGRNFYNKGIAIWRSELAKLNNVPAAGIMKILRISFDGLEDMEKDIFLDIACLLRTEWRCDKDIILKAYGFCSLSIIDHLVDKALIIINWNSLWMHDLIRQMGNEIGKDSRLWKPKEVVDVLSKDEGSSRKRKIEVISSSYLHTDKRIKLQPDAFEEMTSLRILHLPEGWDTSHILLPEGLEVLPNELRWLEWDCYPCPSLPRRFDLENLVELRMTSSKLVQLWSRELWLPKLKCIDVSYSSMLTNLPNLSCAPKLEKLLANGCCNLEEIPNSIGQLVKLKKLVVTHGQRLTSCPELSKLIELKSLSFDSCCSITKLPQLPQNLVKLALNSTRIEELPQCIDCLSRLKVLSCVGCNELKSLPGNIGELKCLEFLNISGCSKLHCLPTSMGDLQSLQQLHATKSGLICLPKEIKYLTNLFELELGSSLSELTEPKSLSFDSCCSITKLPQLPQNLVKLALNSTRIQELPQGIGCLSRLKVLSCVGCNELKSLPSNIGELKCLEFLNISGCSKLHCLPTSVGDLQSLQQLHANKSGLICLPEEIKYLTNLFELKLGSPNLEGLPEEIKHISNLEFFYCLTPIDDIKHLTNI